MAQSTSVGTSVDMYVMVIGGTIMLFLLAGGLIIFIVMYQRRMLVNKIMIQEAQTKHQQELFYGTLEAIEGERKRLARDLHDEVGASLSVMRLLVGEMQKTSTEIPEIDAISNRCKHLIDDTIDNVRRISNDLLPQGLEEFGLAYAIEGLCEKTMEITDINIQLAIQPIEDIANNINLIIYRLIQELLNNAIKHSEATDITLSLKKEVSELILQYTDNGKGFDFPEAYEKRSLGLKNIETRTRMLNGSTQFDTKPSLGLKVEVRIPLENI